MADDPKSTHNILVRVLCIGKISLELIDHKNFLPLFFIPILISNVVKEKIQDISCNRWSSFNQIKFNLMQFSKAQTSTREDWSIQCNFGLPFDSLPYQAPALESVTVWNCLIVIAGLDVAALSVDLQLKTEWPINSISWWQFPFFFPPPQQQEHVLWNCVIMFLCWFAIVVWTISRFISMLLGDQSGGCGNGTKPTIPEGTEVVWQGRHKAEYNPPQKLLSGLTCEIVFS